MKVFHLHHYSIAAGVELWELTDDQLEDERSIGVFSSEEKARAAIEILKTKEGYRDWPGGFRILHSVVDDYDTHGFISWEEAGKPAPPNADA